MAILSGVAKLSSGEPAVQVVAVHPLRGYVRTAVPASDGSYEIAGAAKGEWLVTAKGPPGYRPQSHILAVDQVPEAETLLPKIYNYFSFDGDSTDRQGRPAMSGTAVPVYVQGKVDGAIRRAGSGSWGQAAAHGPVVSDSVSLAAWICPRDLVQNADRNLLFKTRGDQTASFAMIVIAAREGNDLIMRGRMGSSGAFSEIRVPHASSGTWYHVVAVVTTTGITFWVNGIRRHLAAAFNPFVTTFGQSLRLDSVYADVDELINFSAPPTDAEVQYLYAGGAGKSWENLREDAGYQNG